MGGSFNHKSDVNDVFIINFQKDWSENKTKKTTYDLKLRNKFTFVLSESV